jgi:hypothetical protein
MFEMIVQWDKQSGCVARGYARSEAAGTAYLTAACHVKADMSYELAHWGRMDMENVRFDDRFL